MKRLIFLFVFVKKLSQDYDSGTVPDTVPTVILPVHTCQVATTVLLP